MKTFKFSARHVLLLGFLFVISNSACLSPEQVSLSRTLARDSASKDPGGLSPTLLAQISVDSRTGVISGYLYDTQQTDLVFQVELYLDGGPGEGTFLGIFDANESRLGLAVPAGFSFTAPLQFHDAEPRRVYAYLIHPTDGTRSPLPQSPLPFIVGSDSAGEAYFNANLKSELTTNCTSCHGDLFADYFTAREYLQMPSPLDGGTSTQNTFYQRISGQTHSGGNRCGGNILCQKVATWWTLDFGNAQ